MQNSQTHKLAKKLYPKTTVSNKVCFTNFSKKKFTT